jgi:hypothetical protein
VSFRDAQCSRVGQFPFALLTGKPYLFFYKKMLFQVMTRMAVGCAAAWAAKLQHGVRADAAEKLAAATLQRERFDLNRNCS